MTAHVLVIDNIDSFTYNLVQGLRQLDAEVTVRRNDDLTAAEARELGPSHLVVSPGPGRPEHSGTTLEVLHALHTEVPTLGVCLGHQCIAQVLGARIIAAKELRHGKASSVYPIDGPLFRGLPRPFVAGRYHSLAVDESTLPACLDVTARTRDGETMGIRHRTLPVQGVQFHPESVLTPQGPTLLANFLAMEAA